MSTTKDFLVKSEQHFGTNRSQNVAKPRVSEESVNPLNIKHHHENHHEKP
jgi:hypothetical protein